MKLFLATISKPVKSDAYIVLLRMFYFDDFNPFLIIPVQATLKTALQLQALYREDKVNYTNRLTVLLSLVNRNILCKSRRTVCLVSNL